MKNTKNTYSYIRIIALSLIILSYFFAPKFGFLVLNSLLAYIPIEIGLYIHNNKKISHLLFWFLTFIWFIMIPNTFYLITDLYYLSNLKMFDIDGGKGALKLNESLWRYYIILVSTIFFYISIGALSVEKVITKMHQKLNKIIPKFLLLTIFFIANGFAIYIGRFMRFHSIEILTNPKNVIDKIINDLKIIEYNVLLYLIIICAFIYFLITKIIRGKMIDNTYDKNLKSVQTINIILIIGSIIIAIAYLFLKLTVNVDQIDNIINDPKIIDKSEAIKDSNLEGNFRILTLIIGINIGVTIFMVFAICFQIFQILKLRKKLKNNSNLNKEYNLFIIIFIFASLNLLVNLIPLIVSILFFELSIILLLLGTRKLINKKEY